MSVAGRLRELREYLCLTVEEAAALAAIEPSRLAALESGQAAADDVELARIARAYGHSTSYLRDGPSAPATSASRAGSPRLLADLTEHDRTELARFTAFLRDAAGH
jgi:transcriptional regulator with XRE-family HTH domain